MAPPTHTRTCTGPHAAWRGARRGAACGTRPTRPAGAARSPQESTAKSAAICLRKHQQTQRYLRGGRACGSCREGQGNEEGGNGSARKRRNEQQGASRSSVFLYFQRTHNTPDHTTVEHTSVNTPSLSVWSPPGPATCMLALRAGPQLARRRRTDKTTTVGREGIRVW